MGEKRDQNITSLSPLLPRCGFGSGWVSLSMALSPSVQLSRGFPVSVPSLVLSSLEMVMTFCWVVTGSITTFVPLILPHIKYFVPL